MEANKENINRPVPMGQMPYSPKHMLQKKLPGHTTSGEVRIPLRSINTSPLAGPSRVRNVKRSLKRPHSRELQGLSPGAQQERREEEKFKRRLDFNQCSNDILKSDSFIEKDYVTDLFFYLLNTEKRGLVPEIPSVTRACLLNWLMKVNGPESPEVIQTAQWYLDSVLNSSVVRLARLQTVAAACYWISQKLHGPVTYASKLVKCANKAFSSKQLIDAEKTILRRLKFPPQPVIPQEYITCLSCCLDAAHRGRILRAATFLCMCGIMVDRSLCTELPSVIAAACLRSATLMLRNRDLMKQLLSSPTYQAAERKATNISAVCSTLWKAVRIMDGASYEYKTPLDHYGQAPGFIAQNIILCAKELAITGG